MNSQAANQEMAAVAAGTWFALLVLSSFLSGMACLPPSDQSDGRTDERAGEGPTAAAVAAASDRHRRSLSHSVELSVKTAAASGTAN